MRPSASGSKSRATRCRPSTSTDYVVINDQLESCVERIRSIVLAERAKLQCMRPEALKILRSFNVNGV